MDEGSPLLHDGNNNIQGNDGKKHSNYTAWLIIATMVICSSAFLAGYDAACLNGPLASNSTLGPARSIVNQFNMTAFDGELATAMVNVGGMLGAFTISFPSNYLGRKKTLLINNFFYILGTALCAGAPAFWVLVVGRFFVGIGVGAASVMVPQLLSELAAVDIRGGLTTINQLFVTLGIFFAQVFYVGFSYLDYGWRYEVGVSILPALLQCALFWLIPESPAWLVSCSKDYQAEQVLTRIRPASYDTHQELTELKAGRNGHNADQVDEYGNAVHSKAAHATPPQNGWVQLFKLPKIVLIGVAAMAIQILTGINAVMYYSSTIFSFAQLNSTNSLIATIAVTGLNVVMTVVSFMLVDRLGRKPLLLSGLALMTVSLTTAAFALLFAEQTVGGIVCVVMVLLYVAGFAIGLGAVLWPLLGEIFPNSVRSQGMSLCLFTNWLFNLIISLTTISLIKLLGGGDSQDQQKNGAAYLFLIFAGLSLVGFAFIAIVVPETKGKSLEEIQDIILGKKRRTSDFE